MCHAVKSGNSGKILSSGLTEGKLLETYNVKPPQILENSPISTVDSVSKMILKRFHPVTLDGFVPLEVVGDGNCLYRAVSLACYGTQEHHIQLRLRSSIEIILNHIHYDTSHRRHVDHIKDNRIITDSYDKLVKSVCQLGCFQQMIHIFALSAALEIPLQTFFPPTSPNQFLTEPNSRRVFGRGVSSAKSPSVNIMWTMMHCPENGRDFRPNHFVPLHSLQVPEVCDLSASSGQGFPQLSSTPELCDKDTSEELGSPKLSSTPEVISESDVSFVPDKQLDSSNFSCDLNESVDKRSRNPLTQFQVSPAGSPVSEYLEQVELSSLSPECLEMTSSLPDCTNNTSSTLSTPNSNLSNKNEGLDPNESIVDIRQIVKNQANGELPNSKFLGIYSVMDVFNGKETVLEKVPRGPKENLCFVVNNINNLHKRNKKISSEFYDDCGIWDTKSGCSPKTIYLVNGNKFTQLVVKNSVYCIEKQVNKKRTYLPLEPQPEESQLLIVHRSYSKLKKSPQYQRRVTWISQAPEGFQSVQGVALYEYIGTYPGPSIHEKATKSTRPYIRVPKSVMGQIGEMNQCVGPMQAYQRLTETNNESMAPVDVKQIQNKKFRDKRVENPNQYRSNFVDHLQGVENMVYTHPFVQQVVHTKDKVPTVILYTSEQLLDIDRLCIQQGNVLGFDKTFNISKDVHVTACVFKQKLVVRNTTGDNPIFLGPMMLHGSSTTVAYASFFCHLSAVLKASNCDKLVIGTDNEISIGMLSGKHFQKQHKFYAHGT